MGFPNDSAVKNLPAMQELFVGDRSSIPESGRSSGGGHGNPVLYSSLENSMDRGARGATVPRVAKSRTRLKRLSTVSCIHRDNIIQNVSPPWKKKNCLPLQPSSSHLKPQAFTFHHHFVALFRMPYNWNNIVYSLFKLASFHLAICIKKSSIIYPLFILSPT